MFKVNQLNYKAQLKATVTLDKIIKAHANCGFEIDMEQFTIAMKRDLNFDRKGNILEFNP